ncbi:MAG: DUF423 domain-containing protein [Ignavibacteriales bacterium CG_4_9_14_3_um_filter_30_11]|nr:MAG: DUF423 domain-containing protein [Ignavibacteriales bacterium CG_4_9_14_3_um_filter_30_11]
MKKNIFITIAAIYGFLGVALGAFGAHALKDTLSVEMIEIFKTATYYNLIHTVVIYIIGMTGKVKYFRAGFFLSIGVFLFSFSLYIYAITNNTTFAIITPFGGISLLFGWTLIIWESIKKTKE